MAAWQVIFGDFSWVGGVEIGRRRDMACRVRPHDYQFGTVSNGDGGHGRPCPYESKLFKWGVLQSKTMWPDRKISRLREFDYSQNGAYAVTICVFQRRCAFGRIIDGEVLLHPFGLIAQERWTAIPHHHPNIALDEFIIMPNHVHGILFIEGEAPPNLEEETELRQFSKPQSGSLATVIGSFKSGVTKQVGELRGSRTKVWQPRFYDHIIRHDRDLQLQRAYIQSNPSNWAKDEFNTA